MTQPLTGIYLSYAPPVPLRGGTWARCPMIDVPATEAGGGVQLWMCSWKRKASGKQTAAKYRRHFYRDHWLPFAMETEALMQYLAYDKVFGEQIEVTVSTSK